MTNKVYIFSDGSCLGNPGRGGWASLLIYNGKEKELYGAEQSTTNNRMELMAAIKGLEALKKACHVEIITDSQYVKNGITIWIKNWKTRNWKTSDKQDVKNRDLWERLDSACKNQSKVEWQWVKAHSGHKENERVDSLAKNAIKKLK